MALSAEQFGKALVASGLMTADELKALWSELPAAERPKDGETFSSLLRKRDRLNEFQAQELLAGGGTPLVLGDYILLQKIGAGGMGAVYKAQHRRMKRLVAIKLLPSALVKDEASIKRFQREVEAAAKLVHPNIVIAHDAGESRGQHFLVMEYVEGRDLSALVKERGPLPVAEAVDYILQAARGLAFAHAEGVVHRDIKPANLLLDNKGIVKILDMGLARIDDGNTADHQLTNTGTVMGTVDYMPPEQANDTRKADARSDIYSLGCSLYRILTGESVFGGETVVQKIMAHMGDPIPSLQTKRPDCPAEIDRIFQKMLAKRPDDRYQQASQLVAELEAFLNPGATTSFTNSGDSKLTDFLQTLRQPQTTATSLAQPRVRTAVKTEQTIAYAGAEVDTDPKSEVVSAPLPAAGSKLKTAGSAKRSPRKNTRIFVAAGAAGFFLLLLGVFVVIRDKDGNEVARVPVPEAGSVVVETRPSAAPVVATTSNAGAAVRLNPLPPAADSHRRAAEGVIRLGGNVTIATDAHGSKVCSRLEELPAEPFVLGAVDFADAKGLADDDLRVLEEMQFLGGVSLANAKVSIGGLKHLDHLAFSGCLLSAVPLEANRFGDLAARPDLQAINLGTFDRPIDGVLGARLRAFLPQTRAINFLSYYDSINPLTPEGCRELARIATLQELTAVRTTTAGAAELAASPSLRSLDLSTSPELGDDCIEPLSRCKELRFVNLYNKKVTGDAARRLQGLLPEAVVHHPDLPASEEVRGALQWALDQKASVVGWRDGKALESLTTVPATNFAVKAIAFPRDAPPASGAAKLSTLRALNSLYWGSLQNADTEADHLAKLTALTGLSLHQSDLSDAGLAKLTALSGLNQLDLQSSRITDEGYRHIEIFSQLRNLVLNNTAIGDAGLSNVGKLSLLGALGLRGCAKLTDESLRHLINLRQLRELRLGDTPIGDGAVAHLKQMPSLRLLYVNGSEITPQGIAALRAALPKCAIYTDAGWLIPPATPQPATAALPGNAPPIAKAPFDTAQAKAHQQAWAKHLGIKLEAPNSVGQKMVLIPPGEFLMGSTDEQVAAALKAAEEIKADQGVKDRIQKAERPQHKVVITKPFLMSATEVTVGQFKKFSATGYVTEAETAAQTDSKVQTYLNPGYAVTDDSPVTVITWNDAVAYCKWLSEQEKRTYRLPTEAEWEYACKAGTTTHYSFGDDVALLGQYGWSKENAGGRLHPSTTLSPNAFGLFDKHGGLQEWCGDYFDENWYRNSSLNDPIGPPAGQTRVIRGGGWNSYASSCRSAYRSFGTPSHRSNLYGFRCVLELELAATASTSPAPKSSKLFMHDPAFPQWMAQVQALPAEKQIEAVSKKLVELNPGFDGKVGRHVIESGDVKAFYFSSSGVADLSPIRALADLAVLQCPGSTERRALTDISPLKGLRLSVLNISDSNVSDLLPLAGMPLSEFYANQSQISDLAALQRMPLIKVSCVDTKVADLTPLAASPLSILNAWGTSVSDLVPLTTCASLKSLDVGRTKVTAATVAALQKSLPNCKIKWDDPTKPKSPQPTASGTK